MNTPFDLFSVIGLLGTACIIGAYAYLTLSERTNALLLHGTNLTGAVLLTISLVVHTNWASLVLEAFWAAIAMFGIVRALREGRRHKEDTL